MANLPDLNGVGSPATVTPKGIRESWREEKGSTSPACLPRTNEILDKNLLACIEKTILTNERVVIRQVDAAALKLARHEADERLSEWSSILCVQTSRVCCQKKAHSVYSKHSLARRLFAWLLRCQRIVVVTPATQLAISQRNGFLLFSQVLVYRYRHRSITMYL